MKEQRTIVDRWRQGMGSILITLVRVQGSSYRRPGARLLICQDGSYEGNISAGCLEVDLLRKAAWLSRRGAVVERYSTLVDEGTDIPLLSAELVASYSESSLASVLSSRSALSTSRERLALVQP